MRGVGRLNKLSGTICDEKKQAQQMDNKVSQIQFQSDETYIGEPDPAED